MAWPDIVGRLNVLAEEKVSHMKLANLLRPWRMRDAARTAVSCAAAGAMLLQSLAVPVHARQMSRSEYEACQARDEAAFRGAIEDLTHRALQDGLKRVDYPAVVNDEWRKLGFDDTLDKKVDTTVAEVTAEMSFLERGRTLFDKEKAQAAALSVAERVYRSDPVKGGLETMIGGVARNVGGMILLAAADASEPAMECLKAFLGPRYGSTVAGVVSTEAHKEFQIDPSKAGTAISPGAVISVGAGGITGAVMIALRRQLGNIATRVSQRIVGSILGRLVSVVVGGIGAVLIAKDVWELRNGVLPIVAAEMKSKATKDLVKAELAKAISEQINEHSREIATTTADRVIDIWREFRRGHAKVVELAGRNAQFRSFVDTLRPSDLARLDEVVALILGTEGEDGAVRRLKDGSLNFAVTRLDPRALEIAREKKSLEEGIRWTALAGPLLGQVLEHGIHRRAAAADFPGDTLRRVLALEDRAAISRMSQIGRPAREALLELPDRDLRSLAKAITEPELETLARYLTGLTPPARDRVLKTVAAAPSRMQVLAPARVRDAILSSRDQGAAIAMMLRTDSTFDVNALKGDLTLAYEGQVNPVLLWDKHPAAVIGAGLGALMLLLILQRLLFGRRRPSAKAA